MFEAITFPLSSATEHGNLVLLERGSIQGDKRPVQYWTAGKRDGLNTQFKEVMDLTRAENICGSNSGRIPGEDLCEDETGDHPPFSSATAHHKLFPMSLKEHELSFGAYGTFDIDSMSFDMAS
ncbi:hypothetical protein [Pseudophaeobacter sp.]|jgi:hypothetical protein|uniref:hypothetical protein n=1 Tax=Pseudophaeobacter sp. TaxID=1971739 RepID=UPI0025E3638C|nr:hypothetical protein [uncultured Pseudophaeobacter sp.]